MIVGIGTDIVEIKRVHHILNESLEDRFLARVLTPAEQKLASERWAQQMARYVQFVAGRFAAKEAVAKAFGCGISELLSFRHIEILHDEWGGPQCTLAETAPVRQRLRGEVSVRVSISHTDEYAVAFALVESVD